MEARFAPFWRVVTFHPAGYGVLNPKTQIDIEYDSISIHDPS
jgi:hypothetical protein